ncbi:hypothetical protein HFP15_05540 [Amycolatopsis sp. K13G38]|uniref:Uncharacterized protein n=1 Tax=Amycolatopsis acididurans TaxID=2724524 RepID=A0ABX1IY06_9PSEU|nr:hypothetical protein [Amycolatopsis acididurans]NKQ52339.1 hypothetical protein [Amycolatopsis acididurans]
MTTPQVLDNEVPTAEPQHDNESQWLLDPRVAELKPEGAPGKRKRRARKPVPVADRIFD